MKGDSLHSFDWCKFDDHDDTALDDIHLSL